MKVAAILGWLMATLGISCGAPSPVPPDVGLRGEIDIDAAVSIADRDVPAGHYEVRLDPARRVMTIAGPVTMSFHANHDMADRDVPAPRAEFRRDGARSGSLFFYAPPRSQWRAVKGPVPV